jgi:hypothetical protein
MAAKNVKGRSARGKATSARLREAAAEQTLAETEYATSLLRQLTMHEQTSPFLNPEDMNEKGWTPVGGVDVQGKLISEIRDPAIARNQSYRFWRLHPQGRGILRNFVRFIIGRQFKIDFDDQQYGKWNDDRTKILVSDNEDDVLVTKLAWTEFELRNQFTNRRKEIILRTFRDGEALIRRFVVNGRVLIRFVEPEKMETTKTEGVVLESDVDPNDPIMPFYIGKATKIELGIEYVATDRETVIAYHFGDERVPAKDVIHTKAFADSNDLRGIPLLEVVAKTLTNYEQWEHYRIVLNKIRTAVALVRKVEGTAQQARSIIEGRTPTRAPISGKVPQTPAGMREAMFNAGTILTPGPGVTYDFMSPKLDARDAGEDGRRILLSASAGVGLPEQLVTGDYSNSNYSSSVEGRTPAVREWEDWQDFFDPVFKKIVEWVIDAAVEFLGLPETTLRTCELNWPILISKDAAKETARNMNLRNGGILSLETWASREELVYDDELEKMRNEAEDMLMSPEFAAVADQVRLSFITQAPGSKGVTGGGKPGTPPTPILPNEVTGAAAAHPGPTIEAKNIVLKSLKDLNESLDEVEDEDVRAALRQYIFGIARAIKV